MFMVHSVTRAGWCLGGAALFVPGIQVDAFRVDERDKFKHTFILLASSLAYSEASSLFFWVRCLFRAMRRRLCCRTRGVTSLWILGALVLGFLPNKEREDTVKSIQTDWCNM